MRIRFALLLAVGLMMTSAAGAHAHGGGLDGHGCHNDRQSGEYHCHRGHFEGHAFLSKQEMLRQLERVSGGATSSGRPGRSGYQEYDRDLYEHWTDADGDCVDARDEVLRSESRVRPTMSADGCDVLSGEWFDPYTGRTFTNPRDLHVDHLVPLAEAHRSGAYRWSAAKRRAYANDLSDPRSLIAVSAGANMSKGADDPAHWLPENRQYRCTYVRDWVAVKERWNLRMDQAEQRAVQLVQATCANRAR